MKEGLLGAAVFKGLRDRLKKVSAQLEDELEAQLEAELEAELSAATAVPAEPEEVTPYPDEPVEATPQAATRDESTSAKTAAVQASQEGQDGPAAVEDETKQESEPEPEPSAASTPTTPPETTRPAETASHPEAPAQEAPPDSPPAPTREAAARIAAAKQPVYGRKILSADEVEERLRRELGEAVEVQREVERAVQESGAPVTRYTINEDVLDDILWELELGLLESDVALPVIEAIKHNVREQLLSMSVGGRSPTEVVEKVLRSAVRRVLNVNALDFDAFIRDKLADGKKPVVVMFVGVNGTGKTTSIARIAWRLQQAGISSVMAAGDTFRAGAIEQLATHGERLGIRVVKHTAGADPAAVAYDAIEHAKARHKDVVLLDTAGRMQTNTNLMDEMDKIRRVAKPDLVVFVGDSLAGNDAVEQARRFDEVVDIDGAILTKTDVDAKGGAALSVAYTINKPLLFIGVGQDYADLEPFSADKMVGRLFGDEP